MQIAPQSILDKPEWVTCNSEQETKLLAGHPSVVFGQQIDQWLMTVTAHAEEALVEV